MAIAVRLILISLFGVAGICTWADSNPETNEAFVNHLNYYYQDLNLSVGSSADAETIDSELSTLEQVMGQKLKVPDGQLIHLDCNNPACCSGGCCASVCESTDHSK